jgi:hypothetical protein
MSVLDLKGIHFINWKISKQLACILVIEGDRFYERNSEDENGQDEQQKNGYQHFLHP